MRDLRGEAAARGDMSARPWFDRVAHDLRGPLTSLQTAAWLLKNDPGGANASELADIVVRQAQRLGRMIEELDDYGRAEQKRLVDARERVGLGALIDLALTGAAGCTIEPDVAPDAGALAVEGDEARLAQLFRILCLHASARDPQARLLVARDGAHARVTLLDHGPALDAAQRESLLTTPQHPAPDDGLGLRLLTARAIAEAHGGSLQALPGDGDGLRLVCLLPLA